MTHPHGLVYKRRKITRAASWQQKGDVVRRIADVHKAAIAKAIRDAIAHFRKTIDLEEFKQQLRTGSQLGARRAFPRKKYEDALRKAFERMAQCYEDAAKAGAGQIHNLTLHSRRRRVRKDRPGHGGIYAFDRFTPEVQEALSKLQEAFIEGMSQDVADAVEQALYDGMIQGWSVDEIASEIRDVIGLNSRQARAIDNFRSGLEAAGTYSAEEIDQMVLDRAETALDYRADMIARTESIRASNLGLHEGYRQAIDRGVFPQEAVRREWQIALDENTCPICIDIPDMNEGGVAVDEPFDTADGPIMDPPVHPNCRCSVTYITDLDMVSDEEDQSEEETA